MCTTVLSFRRGTKMFKSKAWPWIWYILKSEDFSLEDSDEEKKRVNSILKLDPRHNPGFERTVARSCHAPQKTPQPLSDRHGALWYTTTAQIQSLDKPTALLTMLHHPLLTAPHDRFKEDWGTWFFGRFFLLAVISSAWNAFRARAATTPYVVVVSFASLLGGGWCACHP